MENPESVVFPCEWVDEGRAFGEFLVPAAVVNQYPRREVQDA